VVQVAAGYDSASSEDLDGMATYVAELGRRRAEAEAAAAALEARRRENAAAAAAVEARLRAMDAEAAALRAERAELGERRAAAGEARRRRGAAEVDLQRRRELEAALQREVNCHRQRAQRGASSPPSARRSPASVCFPRGQPDRRASTDRRRRQ